MFALADVEADDVGAEADDDADDDEEDAEGVIPAVRLAEAAVLLAELLEAAPAKAKEARSGEGKLCGSIRT